MANSLMAMISRIIDYARIEKGELQPLTGPFDPRQVVSEIAAGMSPRAQTKGLEYETAVAPNVPRPSRSWAMPCACARRSAICWITP